jgi:hypothetical protein
MKNRLLCWMAHVELSSAVVVFLALGVLIGDTIAQGTLQMTRTLGVACALMCFLFGGALIKEHHSDAESGMSGLPFTLMIGLIISANLGVVFNLFAYPIVTLLFQLGTLLAVILLRVRYTRQHARAADPQTTTGAPR